MDEMTGIEDQITNSWRMHDCMTRSLLAAVEPEAVAAGSPSRHGQTAGQLFADLHNRRFDWLVVAAPELIGGMKKVLPQETTDKELLQQSLELSGPAIQSMIQTGIHAGKINGFGPDAFEFMGYLISKEGYLLSEIAAVLTECGFKLQASAGSGPGEWDKL